MEAVGITHFKTVSGLFKLLEILLSLVAFICTLIFSSSWSWSALAFLKTVCLMGMIYAFTLSIFYLTHCVKGFNMIEWNKLDCIMCIFLSILFFISSSMIVYYEKPASLEAAVVFGYGSASVFIFNSIHKIMFSLN